MKPRILIVGDDCSCERVPHFFNFKLDYNRAITRAGGLPLGALDPRHPEDYLDFSDGLLLTGGPDLHYGRYGEVYEDSKEILLMNRFREAYEFDLCRLFLEAGKPILGIGRGMQVLNVALGGSLNRDIPGHRGELDSDYPLKAALTSHKISVSSSSRLFTVLNKEETVNSCHHQSVKRLGSGLSVAATAADGTIEAIEHTDLPCFGVQWHPEDSADDRVFVYFISACKEGSR